MPVRFDPYYKWLGIPQSEQPAHHYRLLGIQPFESDPDVISNAADQRMGLLKSFANSEHSSLAEDLLNEVARTRVCLLNATKKQAYDSTLRERLGSDVQGPESPASFWLPPRNGVADTIVVSCLNCQEDNSYPLAPLPQILPCKSCHKILQIPSRGEVSAAAAQLGSKSPPLADQSSSVKLGKAGIASNSTTIQQLPLPSSAAKADVTRNADPEFVSLADSLIHDRAAKLHRRNKSTQSPLMFILSTVVGGFAGLAAGYLILCHFDLRYDFLHLIPIPANQPLAQSSTANSPPRVITPHRSAIRPTVPQETHPKDETPSEDVPQFNLPRPQNPQARGVPKRNAKPPIRIPRIGDPFVNLPRSIPLLRPGKGNNQFSLFEVPLEQLNNFELTIINSGNEQKNHLVLKQRPSDGDAAKLDWEIKWQAENLTDVATITLANDDLRFQWANNAVDVAVAALRNSILKVRGNQTEHFVKLREADFSPPATFNLNKGAQHIAINCDDLPDVDEIRLDILSLQACPPYRHEGKGLLRLQLNDETIIWYPEAAGAGTKIKFANLKGVPTIELEHRYRLPSGVEDAIEIQGIQRRANALRRALAKKDNAKLKADLDALGRIEKLSAKLDDKVKLQYRAYCFVDGQEIQLVTAR
jgi:hypothetical protein